MPIPPLAAATPDGKRQAMLRALLMLALLLCATLWMGRESSDETARLAQERFSFKVKEAELRIRERLKAYEQVLRGGVGLFAANRVVGRDTWRAYVRSLEVDTNYPGIQGIGFAVHVPPAHRHAHVQAMRDEGFAAYDIRPAGERDEYTSIVYLEPFDWRNQRAFGYDMFTDRVRRAAMARARDLGMPSVSGKVQLVQETSKDVQNGFLMYLPVYRKGAPQATVDERRAALAGYVYAPLRMHDLMRGVLDQGMLSHIQLQVFDGEPGSAPDMLYDGIARSEGKGAQRRLSAFSIDRHFEFNGRQWTLRFSPAPAFDAAVDWQKPRIVLFAGMLISILFSLVVRWSALNRHQARALALANRDLQAEVDERTRLTVQFEHAKNLAEAADDAKSEFLANMSHELRTPLTLMLAPLEQLREQRAAPADWYAQTARVRRNALLLLNRVNDILDFSKAQAGKLDVLGKASTLPPRSHLSWTMHPSSQSARDALSRGTSRFECANAGEA